MSRKSVFLPIMVGIVLATGLAACGSDSKEPASSGDASERLSLTVAIPNFVDLLPTIAQVEGFFEEQNLDVTIQENAGANVMTLVSSGQADLGLYATPGPLLVSLQGKQTSVILGSSGGGLGAYLVGSPDGPDSMESLAAKPGCRIGSFPPGSSTYGYAVIIMKQAKLDCEVVPFSDNASVLGALTSNRIDAATVSYSTVASSIKDLGLNLLVDPRKASDQEKYVGAIAPDLTYWGMKDTLSDNREAVVRFVKAINEAREFLLDPSNASGLAVKLDKIPDFPGKAEDIEDAFINSLRPFLTAKEGYIDEDLWNTSLEVFKDWGIPGFDATGSEVQYDQQIDMSFFDDSKN